MIQAIYKRLALLGAVFGKFAPKITQEFFMGREGELFPVLGFNLFQICSKLNKYTEILKKHHKYINGTDIGSEVKGGCLNSQVVKEFSSAAHCLSSLPLAALNPAQGI